MKVLTIGTFLRLFIWTYLFDPIWQVDKLNKYDRITETYTNTFDAVSASRACNSIKNEDCQ